MSNIIIKPQEGFQQKFLSSEADIVIGGGAAGCQRSTTLVLTSTGHKQIKDIKVGEFVQSFNVKSKQLEFKEVIDTFKYGGINDPKDMCEIKIGNQNINLTTNHEFYIESNWIATELIAKRVLERSEKLKQEVLCIESRESSDNKLAQQKTSSGAGRYKESERIYENVPFNKQQKRIYSSTSTCSGSFSTECGQQTSSESYRQSERQQQVRESGMVHTSRELRPFEGFHEDATETRLFTSDAERFTDRDIIIGRESSQGNKREIYTKSIQQGNVSRGVWSDSIVYQGYSHSQELEACELNVDRIDSVKLYKSTEYVYDLCVLDNHNYCITTDNIIVHNSGKALSVDSLILLEDGNFVEIQDISKGDYVIGDDGKPTLVVSVIRQQDLNFYRVEFTDNTYVDACEDHLWRVKVKGDDDWTVRSTREMLDCKIRDSYKYEIPLVEPIELDKKKDLPLDPYLLGVFLGDGHFTKNGTVSLAVGFEELEGLKKYLPRWNTLYSKGTCYKVIYKQFKDIIKELGLNGKVRDNKFIPVDYLTSSIEDRLALLQGLLDTDGTVSTRLSGNVSVSFCNQNKNLIDGVVQLVRSLGGVASVYHYVNSANKRDEYYVNIRMALNPFRLDRKADVFKSIVAKKKIRSITKIVNQTGICLGVNNKNNCYITNDFTVTHNSYALILELARLINVENTTGVIFRRTSPELRAGGGLWDTATQMYSPIATINNTKLELTFPSNSKIKFSHLQLENDIYTHQGSQYAFIGFDEIQHFSWGQFRYMMSRNRTMSDVRPYIRCTCNPETGIWLRDFIDWWIGGDGFPLQDRDGVIRYMYMKGSKVKDIVWGNSKQEVIDKLDGVLEEIALKFDVAPEDLIKSVTFIAGSLEDNKKLLQSNPDYVANLLAQDEVDQAKLLYGNWNEFSDDTQRLFNNVDRIFSNVSGVDVNGLYSISVDPARQGKDLAIVMLWKGFEVMGMQIFTKCSTEDIYNAIEVYRDVYSIPRHLVVVDSDGVGGGVVDRGRYLGINNGGRPVESKNETTNFTNLKSQLYYLAARVINNNEVTGFKINTDQIRVDGKLTKKINGELISDRIEEEFKVYTRDYTMGKKRINSKEEIKKKIGHSSDFTDCIVYNLYFYLNRQIYGLNSPTK